MLAPEEFAAGTLASAPTGSLILPRNKYEEAFVIGLQDDVPTAVFLSGTFKFHYFPSTGSENWSGLIIQNVRFEVDESTAFDPRSAGSPFGALVRTATELSVKATAERSFGRSQTVPLVSKLPNNSEDSVGFTKWQIVIGTGYDKRILLDIDSQTTDQ